MAARAELVPFVDSACWFEAPALADETRALVARVEAEEAALRRSLRLTVALADRTARARNRMRLTARPSRTVSRTQGPRARARRTSASRRGPPSEPSPSPLDLAPIALGLGGVR